MNLIRFNTSRLPEPFDRIGVFQRELNRLFDSSFGAAGEFASSEEWRPSLDLAHDEENVVVSLDAPGMSKDAFDISLANNTLTISGERKTPDGKDGESVLRRERFSGRFSRSITLPPGIEADKVSAEYTDGILTVSLPKAEVAKPRRISIR